MTQHHNPDAFISHTITEEDLKAWESGKWKGKRYNYKWLREVKLPEIRSRPAPSPAQFTPYIPGKDQSNTYRCCEVCPNVLTKPVFRVNCMQPQHDAAIAAQAREEALDDAISAVESVNINDVEDARDAIESLRREVQE